MASASMSVYLQAHPPPYILKLRLKPPNSVVSKSLRCPVNSFDYSSSERFVEYTSSDGLTRNSRKSWRVSAATLDAVPSDATPLESSQEIVSSSDDGVSTVIQVLLFTAFIGLTILTIGVIYIAVTDFLQKREREKFEKEEAAKKGGKKGKVRARAGPRGFGQKLDLHEYDDD